MLHQLNEFRWSIVVSNGNPVKEPESAVRVQRLQKKSQEISPLYLPGRNLPVRAVATAYSVDLDSTELLIPVR